MAAAVAAMHLRPQEVVEVALLNHLVAVVAARQPSQSPLLALY